MHERRQLVLGPGSVPTEDELRLPRSPGVIRRFWARHPLLSDVLIAITALLLTLPAVTVRSPTAATPDGWTVFAAVMLAIAGCIALVWRRRWPLSVFAVSLAPALVVEPALAVVFGGPVSVIALYSVAVYRGVRECWIAFGVASALIAVHSLVHFLLFPADAAHSVDLSTIVFLLLGALVGVNVGNRRRYLAAIIDRSRQLLIERDQQAELAAVAERTRIAREMHDIVSHSLTVIVALSEGAAASTDPSRQRQASLSAAETARSALDEMRAMLGVLRSDTDEDASFEPLEPADPIDVVAAARRTGYPIVAEMTGTTTDVPRATRFALGRIVQEAVTNALRHAPQARTARLSVRRTASSIEVVMDNDGASGSRSTDSAGFGLRGLRERVEHAGGTFSAGPTGTSTWRLRVDLPVSPPTGDETGAGPDGEQVRP